jgi:hypothetical protein
MNFQQLKNNDPMIESALIDFCIRSKPYDFCSIKNSSVRLMQIKKYYEHLLRECDIFYVAENQKVVFFIAISEYDDRIEIQFIFSTPFFLTAKTFKAFREFYWGLFDCSLPFMGEVKRQHKLKTYLNAIQKRDPNAKVFLDKDPILVSYTRDGL